MALVKETLKESIYNGLYNIFIGQSNKATSGDENEDPHSVIENVSMNMASIISDAIEAYIKSGDIIVGPNNIQVISSAPGAHGTVTPLQPAKIV